jgi:hypothetical protein
MSEFDRDASHTPPRICSISASGFCGKAARKFSRPTRCSGSKGPIRRMKPPMKFAVRLRSSRLIALKRLTTNAPTIESRKS